MHEKVTSTNKSVVISKFGAFEKPDSKNIYWMTENEFTRIIVGKEASNSEYVISEGIIEPDGFVPDHYHKWEDQTFHVIEGNLEGEGWRYKLSNWSWRFNPLSARRIPLYEKYWNNNVESTPKTNKIKKASFGDIFLFLIYRACFTITFTLNLVLLHANFVKKPRHSWRLCLCFLPPYRTKLLRIICKCYFEVSPWLILRHHRISKNKNLIQINSFCEDCLFSEWTQC